MGGGVSKKASLRQENADNGNAVYEVNVTLDKSETAEADFQQWLTSHTTELHSSAGFVKCEYFKEQSTKPTVVFVLGGPGSGKGTQCERIVKEFDFCHISAGDCLREEQESGSSDAELINQYIKEGKLVPINIVIKLLVKAMDKSDKNRFLVDGFPRSMENYEGWVDNVGDKADVAFVLYLDCPNDVMETRLLERAKTSGRADDNIETIKKRFETFQNESKPIVTLYESEKKLRRIHAEKDLEGVWEEVKTAFTELQVKMNSKEHYTIHFRFENYDALAKEETELQPKMESSLPESLKDKVQIRTRYLLNAKEV